MNNIVLVGPMGSGKSTVGRALATQLNMPFFDSDHELEARCGADIPWIFDIEGEAGFRRRETETLEYLFQQTGMVLATGGGAVLLDANRKLMRAHATVVYLTASLDVLFSRVAKDQNRPLLQVENPRQVYQNIYQERQPLYEQVCDFKVVASIHATPQQMAKEIMTKLDNLK